MLHKANESVDVDQLLQDNLEGNAAQFANALMKGNVLTSDEIHRCLSHWMDQEKEMESFEQLLCSYIVLQKGIPVNLLLPYLEGGEDLEETMKAIHKFCRARSESAGNTVDVPHIPGLVFKKMLGRGGQGYVWLAEQPHLARTVAVKILRDSVIGSVSRFKREAVMMSQLPPELNGKLVMVHDVQPLPDREGFYTIMEYIEGGSSFSAVDSTRGSAPISPEDTWEICLDVLKTLARIQESDTWGGTVHRDIKPANIMVQRRGNAIVNVKIADWGAATPGEGTELEQRCSSVEGEGAFRTQTGTYIGTAGYWDPDLMPDGRFDVYSLGMTARALLMGRQPFSDAASTPTQILQQQKKFSVDVQEHVGAKQKANGKKMTGESPEMAPILRNPKSEVLQALAYLAERASLPGENRPFPVQLLSELSEKFPDLTGEFVAKNIQSQQHLTRRKWLTLVGAGGVAAITGTIGAQRWFSDEEEVVEGQGEGNGGNHVVKPENGGGEGTVVPEAVPDKWPPDVLDLSAVGLDSIDFKGGENAYQQMEGGTVWRIHESTHMLKYAAFTSNKEDNFLIFASGGEVVFRNGSDDNIKKIEFKRDREGKVLPWTLQPRFSDPRILDFYKQFGEPIGEPVVHKSIIERHKHLKLPSMSTRILLGVFANDILRGESMQGRKLQNRPEWIDSIVSGVAK